MSFRLKNTINLSRQFSKITNVSKIGAKLGGLVIGGAFIASLSFSASAQQAEQEEHHAPAPQVSHEDGDWAKAKKSGRIKDFGHFVEQYPDSEYKHDAESFALASLHRQSSGSAYTSFVKYFPNANLDDYTGPREHHEPAPQVSHEDGDWEKAKKSGRIKDYGHFVEQYPDSKYAHDAESFALASLHRQSTHGAYQAFVKYFPNANLETYTGPRTHDGH
jgi:hypothetical protein